MTNYFFLSVFAPFTTCAVLCREELFLCEIHNILKACLTLDIYNPISQKKKRWDKNAQQNRNFKIIYLTIIPGKHLIFFLKKGPFQIEYFLRLSY